MGIPLGFLRNQIDQRVIWNLAKSIWRYRSCLESRFPQLKMKRSSSMNIVVFLLLMLQFHVEQAGSGLPASVFFTSENVPIAPHIWGPYRYHIRGKERLARCCCSWKDAISITQARKITKILLAGEPGH